MLDYILLAAIGLFIVIYLYGAAYITYCVVRSAMFEGWQKVIIVTMSWLIPIVGPAFIYRLLEEEIADTGVTKPPLVTRIYLSADNS